MIQIAKERDALVDLVKAKDIQVNEGIAVELALDSVVWSQGELLKASETNADLWEERFNNQVKLTHRQTVKKRKWIATSLGLIAVVVLIVVFDR